MTTHSKGTWLNFERNINYQSQKQSSDSKCPLLSKRGCRSIQETLGFSIFFLTKYTKGCEGRYNMYFFLVVSYTCTQWILNRRSHPMGTL